MKKLVEVWYYYGKRFRAELGHRFAIEDTRDERARVLDEYGYGEADDDREKFLAGETDGLQFYTASRYWDEPTSHMVIIFSKEDKLIELGKKFERDIAEINNLIEGE